MVKKLKHIELFSGCGGMTLGLEGAGFELYMANELSPMAGETFAYNLLGEDLSKLAEEGKSSQKVIWIKSKFKANNLAQRLRENPFEFDSGQNQDLNGSNDLKGKLILGNIDHFNIFLKRNPGLCQKLKDENIDVLSGGPPCQGFSLAGKRIKDDYKNLLPLSFANFAELIKPKVVILENVKGITSPFKTADGIKHYAWLEVAKAFSLKGFVPVCMLLNSKYFSVPQNRPRFIMFAFRRDIFEKLQKREINSKISSYIINNSFNFFNKVVSSKNHLSEIKSNDILLYNIETNPELFDGNLLPKIQTTSDNFITASVAIDELKSTKKVYRIDQLKSDYSIKLNSAFIHKYDNINETLQNHDNRKHSNKVRARFRIYQILNNLNGIKKNALQVISGKCQDEKLLQAVFNAFKNENLLIESGNDTVFFKPNDLNNFKKYVKSIESKKHSQRAIKKNEPAPAQLTIPDDLCHYSKHELRTFTVREMARFQTFPDWFVFKSKVTTGGKQRSFEVPQYTQVGNAVPPLLAYSLGKVIINILKRTE